MRTKESVPQIYLIFGLSLIFMGLISLTNLAEAQQQHSSSSSGSCHLRELDLCAATLLVFIQSPGGLATNEQEINKQCVHLRDADSCLKNYTRKCMTPLQREMVSFTANSSFQLIDEYCTRGTQFRANYLKHSNCLNQVQKKDQRVCIKDVQASLELLTGGGSNNNSENNGKRLQLACCSYKRFESCMSNQVESKCGKEALSFIKGIVRRITSRLPETMCRNYKPEQQECKTLLPKPGTIPKGSKSNSILSRLFSAYSGF